MTTLRFDIRRIVDESGFQLPDVIFAALAVQASKHTLNVTLAQMVKARQLETRPKRGGGPQGSRFEYGPGETPVVDSYSRGPKARPLKGFMQMAREARAKARGRA